MHYAGSYSWFDGKMIIVLIIGILICIALMFVMGCVSKCINEKKGYKGGFIWGFLLGVIGIIVVALKANINEQKTVKEEKNNRIH